VIDGIAERAVLDERHVKGKYRRLLSAAFMIRVIVLWTMMPDAQMSDVITALAGDLALVPWSKRWRPASERACLDCCAYGDAGGSVHVPWASPHYVVSQRTATRHGHVY
jgi:hypothetical protein